MPLLTTGAGSGGGPSGGVPDAPSLSLVSATWDTTPDFDVGIPVTALVGDVLRIQDDPGSGYVDYIVHTIISGDLSTGTISASGSALANGTYAFRARMERGAAISAWSSPVVNDTVNDFTPSLTSPTGTRLTGTTAGIQVTTDNQYGTIYWIVTASATPPSVGQIQAGHDNSGSAALASGSFSVSASGALTLGIATGLTDGATYHVYCQQHTLSARDSTVSGAAFTMTAPAASFASNNAYTVNWGFTLNPIFANCALPGAFLRRLGGTILNTGSAMTGAVFTWKDGGGATISTSSVGITTTGFIYFVSATSIPDTAVTFDVQFNGPSTQAGVGFAYAVVSGGAGTGPTYAANAASGATPSITLAAGEIGIDVAAGLSGGSTMLPVTGTNVNLIQSSEILITGQGVLVASGQVPANGTAEIHSTPAGNLSNGTIKFG